MSLDDKFYPEDGTLLTKFDNYMIEKAGKLGSLYQNLTGKTHREIVGNTYRKAGIVFGVGFANPALILYSLGSFGCSSYPQIETPIEEENRLEALGKSKREGKVARFLKATSCAIVPLIIGLVEYAIVDGGETPISDFLLGTQVVGMSGFIPLTFASYLEKANLPEPPKKTIFEKLNGKYVLDPKPLPYN